MHGTRRRLIAVLLEDAARESTPRMHARTHTHTHRHTNTHTHTHTHARCGRAEEELRACQAARDKALEELETIRLDPDFYFAGLTSGGGGASARGMGGRAGEEGGEAEEEEVDFDSAGEGSASEEVDFDALPPAPRPPVRVQA